MGTSLLSERLKVLEEDGVVRRTVAARPARSVLYELTENGVRLADAMAPLSRWGAAQLGPMADEEFRPEWMAFTIKSMFRPEEADDDVHDCYEFRLDGSSVWVTVDGREIAVTEERPRRPDLVVITDVPTLAALGSGQLSPEDAAEQGLARYEGDPDAGARALRLLGIASHASVPVRLRRRRATRR